MGVSGAGVIENMTCFIPTESARSPAYSIFGSGGGALLASEATCPCLPTAPENGRVEGGDRAFPLWFPA